MAFLAFSFTFFLITILFINDTSQYIIIISKITCLSINACHHLQVRAIGCSALQNWCQLHYNTADSVLASGCSFISQHIWIKICIMLAILGRCIQSEKFSTGRICMRIRLSGQQIDDFGTLSSGIVTCLGGWYSRQMWRRLWTQLSALVRWRCTWTLASPLCLRILYSTISARKESGCLVLTKHSLVSFYRSFHLFMPRKHNTPLLLFSDLGARFQNLELCFHHCGGRQPSIGNFCQIQGQLHIGLFKLYPTSLPCHSSRHVENLQEIHCCLWQWD